MNGNRSKGISMPTAKSAESWPRDRMRKLAAFAGMVGPVLFGGVLVILTLVEYDFMRGLGWEPLGLSNTDWPSGLALGLRSTENFCPIQASARSNESSAA